MNSISPPDHVFFLDNPHLPVSGEKSGSAWTLGDSVVTCRVNANTLSVDVQSPQSDLRWVKLRWKMKPPTGARFLGDHWERGYGDLSWRGITPERVMPWYFLMHVNGQTTGWGVKTGTGAMCCWTVDSGGISLWLDLRNGTEGVQLGGRTLRAADVVYFESDASPFQAARDFCRQLCPSPRLPAAPVYGANDWYYAYGLNSQETALNDAKLISELAGDAKNRPFSVIDAGWQQHGGCQGSPWDVINDRFTDMAKLAQDIRSAGSRPGIWIRPLLTNEDVPAGWTLQSRGPMPMPETGNILDISVPDALEKVAADIRRLRGWGYELVKHDFSTFDIFMKWGFEMGSTLTAGSWSFADRSRTTAELITGFYRTIREAAGEMLVLGCNTIGHLGAGLFELQRTGDDTSGRNWERTRRMGVNTLAFRMAQHGTFFAADADCAGVTTKVPWELNRQWLSLLAESGTPLFVSVAREAMGAEQKAALKQAVSVASTAQEPAEPLDWMENSTPERWRVREEIKTYDWNGTAGSSPFIMA